SRACTQAWSLTLGRTTRWPQGRSGVRGPSACSRNSGVAVTVVTAVTVPVTVAVAVVLTVVVVVPADGDGRGLPQGGRRQLRGGRPLGGIPTAGQAVLPEP